MYKSDETNNVFLLNMAKSDSKVIVNSSRIELRAK